jgi:hypothetical protein
VERRRRREGPTPAAEARREREAAVMVTCGGARAEAWPCAWERGGAETVALFGCAATLEKASTGCKTVRLSSTGDRYYLFSVCTVLPEDLFPPL